MLIYGAPRALLSAGQVNEANDLANSGCRLDCDGMVMC